MLKHIVPQDAEREFGIDELFFSTTDKRGVITAGNDVFVRVSGYTLEELLGRPHNIIRHPDMPRAVFYLLWEYVKSHKSIAAYVKNMAKDGKYYWVLAYVIPIDGGYLSIRLKPTSPLLAQVRDIYAELRTLEQEHQDGSEGRKGAMLAAADRLGEILAAKGFDSYDAFMQTALVEEMKYRDRALDIRANRRQKSAWDGKVRAADDSLQHLHEAVVLGTDLQQHFVQVFCGLEDYLLLYDKLLGKSQFILNLSQSIGRLSMNATIESARLREEGVCLSVVADWMRCNSQDIYSAITELTPQMRAVADSLKRTAFDIAASRLNIEMMAFFLSELLSFKGDAKAQTSGGDYPARANVHHLAQVFASSVSGTTSAMAALNAGLTRLAQQLDHVLILIRTVGFAHVIGKVEAARLQDSTVFTSIFDEVYSLIQDSRCQLEDLIQTIAAIEIEPLRTAEVETFLHSLS